MRENEKWKKKKKVKVNSESIIKTHAEVWHCANILYKRMQEKPSGWLYFSLPIVTMCVFSIEGLCNFIGNEKIVHWKEIEMTTSIKSKLNILMQNNKNYWSKEPWQTIAEMIIIRNMLAHPKAEIIKKTEKLELSDEYMENYPTPKARWQKTMDMNKIKTIMEKTYEAMAAVCKMNEIDPYVIAELGTVEWDANTL
jgi:hypothetical protein